MVSKTFLFVILALFSAIISEESSGPNQAQEIIDEVSSIASQYLSLAIQNLNDMNAEHIKLSTEYYFKAKNIFELVLETEADEKISYWKTVADKAGVNVEECLVKYNNIKIIQTDVFAEFIECLDFSMFSSTDAIGKCLNRAEKPNDEIQKLDSELANCAETSCFKKIIEEAENINASLPLRFNEIYAEAYQILNYGVEEFNACALMEPAKFSDEIYPVVNEIIACIKNKIQ